MVYSADGTGERFLCNVVLSSGCKRRLYHRLFASKAALFVRGIYPYIINLHGKENYIEKGVRGRAAIYCAR